MLDALDEQQKLSQGILKATGKVLGVSEDTLSDLETAQSLQQLAEKGRGTLRALCTYFDAESSSTEAEGNGPGTEVQDALNATPVSLAISCVRYSRNAASFLAASPLAGSTEMVVCSSKCLRWLAEILDVIFMIDVMKQESSCWQQRLAPAISACQERIKASTLEAITSFADAQWGAVQLFQKGLMAMPALPSALNHLLKYIMGHLQSQEKDNRHLLLPSERSMLHRALAVTLFLLFPDSPSRAIIQTVGHSTVLSSVRILRSQPIVAGWGACKAVWLLSLPATSQYLASLGLVHGKAYQLSPANELGNPATSPHSSCNPLHQLADLRSTFQHVSERLWSLSVRARAPRASAGLPSNKVAEEALETGKIALSRLLSRPHLVAMVELLCLIQGLVGQLREAEEWLLPLLNQAMHSLTQVFVATTLPGLNKQGSAGKREAARAFLRNMKGGFKAKVANPSRAAFTRSRTLFPSKRMRISSPGSASPTKAKAPQIDSASPARAPTANDENISEGHVEELAEQSTRQIAPSPVQMHALLLFVEQLLQELHGSGGKQVLGEKAQSKACAELLMFQQLLQQWPVVSDICTSAAQACNLGLLGMQIPPYGPDDRAASNPLDMLLPWQMIHEIVANPVRGPAELCLVPLKLFSDASQLALLQESPNMAAQAARDAELCFNELLKPVARQVFESHMAIAAEELTEQEFLSHCTADHDRLFPALARHQHFHGLLRHQMVALPDANVDFHACLSLEVQACFETAARVLLDDFEASDISGLVALEALQQVLERSHVRLSGRLVLDPWDQIWAAADGQTSSSTFQSRVLLKAVRQVKDHVMADFVYCASNQRFARLHQNAADVSARFVGQSWPAPLLGRPYGPGGLADGMFSSWVDLHNRFFGAEHIAAFLNLTGHGGASALLESLTRTAKYACDLMINPGLAGLADINLKGTIDHHLLGDGSMPKADCLDALAQAAVKDLEIGISKCARKVAEGLTKIGSCAALLLLLEQTLEQQRVQDLLMGMPLFSAESSSEAHSQSSMRLLPNFLQRIGPILEQASNPERRQCQAPFAAVWSRLLTLHLDDAGSRSRMNGWASQGDGLFQGAAIVLHMMGEGPSFRLHDPTCQILRGASARAPAGKSKFVRDGARSRTTGDAGKGNDEASGVQTWQKQGERALAVVDHALNDCILALPMAPPPAQLALGGPDGELQAFPSGSDLTMGIGIIETASTNDHLQALHRQGPAAVQLISTSPQDRLPAQAQAAALQALEASFTIPAFGGALQTPHASPSQAGSWPVTAPAVPEAGQLLRESWPNPQQPSAASNQAPQTMTQDASTTATASMPLDWESFLLPSAHGSSQGTPTRERRQWASHMQPQAHVPSQRFPAIFIGAHKQNGSLSGTSNAVSEQLPLSHQQGPGAQSARSVHPALQHGLRHEAGDQPSSMLDADNMAFPYEAARMAEQPQSASLSPPRVQYPSINSMDVEHRQAPQQLNGFGASSTVTRESQPQAGMPLPPLQFPPPGETPRAGMMPIMDRDKAIRNTVIFDKDSALQPSMLSDEGTAAEHDARRPSAPQFPEVYGAAKLNEPLPGSPVVPARSIVKFPAIANGIPSAPPLAAQTPHLCYPRSPPWNSYTNVHHSASSAERSPQAATSASNPFPAARPGLPTESTSSAQTHATSWPGYPRPAFHVTPLELPFPSFQSPGPSNDAGEAPPGLQYPRRPQSSMGMLTLSQDVQLAGIGPVEALEQQQMTRADSPGSNARNAMGSRKSAPHSPNARIMSTSLQVYESCDLMVEGRPATQLTGSFTGLHGAQTAARDLRSQPSRARDAIGRFERAATFKSAVTDQDANPPALASPTEAAIHRPNLAGIGLGRMNSSFAPPSFSAPYSPDRPHSQAGRRTTSPVQIYQNAAQMGQPLGSPFTRVQQASADVAVAGPLGANLQLAVPMGLQPSMGRQPSPQVSPRSPRRPIWEQLLGSVGTIMRPNGSPPRARSPVQQPDITEPSSRHDIAQSLQMQQQAFAGSPPYAGFIAHPDAGLALQQEIQQQQQQAMQQYIPATRNRTGVAYPPASRAGFVHSISWGMSQPPYPQEVVAMGAPPAHLMPSSMQDLPARRPPLDLGTKSPTVRSFQSPMRPPARLQPTVPSMVRSASRASRWGAAAGVHRQRDSLQEQAGPLGAARMGPAPPVISSGPVPRPSTSIAGAVASQGFSQLETRVPFHPNRPIAPQRLYPSSQPPSGSVSPAKQPSVGASPKASHQTAYQQSSPHPHSALTAQTPAVMHERPLAVPSRAIQRGFSSW
ncbi:hypothetical protein WJX74_009629 [Apatococcus lobatus]|uniref:Uncharacterized protein n=1 Tax=Apatococcus lobatus TaxID=904363 RepID=A0AAW1SAJ4_9CHLO